MGDAEGEPQVQPCDPPCLHVWFVLGVGVEQCRRPRWQADLQCDALQYGWLGSQGHQGGDEPEAEVEGTKTPEPSDQKDEKNEPEKKEVTEAKKNNPTSVCNSSDFEISEVRGSGGSTRSIISAFMFFAFPVLYEHPEDATVSHIQT